MSAEVDVVVNGASRHVTAGATVADLVAVLGLFRGVAVAVEGDVIPRSEWSMRQLAGGERIEVVTAVQGG